MSGTLLNKAKIIAKLGASRTALGRSFLINRSISSSKSQIHPFDIQYRVRTGGLIPQYLLNPKQKLSDIMENQAHPYFGCSPNCLRAALNRMSVNSDTIFLDLGCGMGRAAIVASEFNFGEIIGVEISKELCVIARRNAKIIQENFPERPSIEIINCDARRLKIKPANTVAFMYNPFGPDLIKDIVRKFDRTLEAGYYVAIIYENPTYFSAIDSSEHFSRCFGLQVKCSDAERIHMFDDDEAVAVWHSDKIMNSWRAEFDVKIVTAGTRAEVVVK